MGCPFPILAKRHNGSGILPFPEEVEKLLGIVHKYPEIDFSVKCVWDGKTQTNA